MDLKLGDTQMILRECERRAMPLAQAAYVLATGFWETNRTMKPVEEAYWLKNAEAWREKNLRYYPWHGRGYVQLTWQQNYIRAGQALGADLITDPDAALVPKYAVPILVIGMSEGWFTGKKLADYIGGGKTDYRNARRIVNGTDRAKEIADLAHSYAAALDRAGYGTARPAPVAVEVPFQQPTLAEWFRAFWASIFGKGA